MSGGGGKQPSIWTRIHANCRRVLAFLRGVFFPSPTLKSESTNTCCLKAEDRTIERLTAMLKKCPHCHHPYLLRGQLYHQQQQYEAAIADYSEYLSRNPADAGVYFNRGVCHHLSGSREKALADYNEAIWRNPRAAVALVRRAWLFFELGAFQRAIQDAATAVEIRTRGA